LLPRLIPHWHTQRRVGVINLDFRKLHEKDYAVVLHKVSCQASRVRLEIDTVRQ
jgi:hypothetical protein